MDDDWGYPHFTKPSYQLWWWPYQDHITIFSDDLGLVYSWVLLPRFFLSPLLRHEPLLRQAPDATATNEDMRHAGAPVEVSQPRHTKSSSIDVSWFLPHICGSISGVWWSHPTFCLFSTCWNPAVFATKSSKNQVLLMNQWIECNSHRKPHGVCHHINFKNFSVGPISLVCVCWIPVRVGSISSSIGCVNPPFVGQTHVIFWMISP